MGHVISEAGIATDPEKKKILYGSTQRMSKLRVLVLGYYRKFIQNFSKLAKCLHKLTEKGRKFEWTNECQSAFEELKNRLVSSPILAHPDFSKKFILVARKELLAVVFFVKHFKHYLYGKQFIVRKIGIGGFSSKTEGQLERGLNTQLP
ncbi:MAG: hypothetical protein H0A76_12815 [Candidatus Thiodubiliella endoseptemdiera]|uniref:Reverse transcriptase/retrotransposon-derived protein RNase H-like domain-containing protein n=1 Tax=Candidatus Thiodubiliella endoseptemdiera TaxID=2738886 RepID=A0A853F939_9GAMM|nr:hypothetical protein [Candidatus Thiodubiliella endoseptemdiera]